MQTFGVKENGIDYRKREGVYGISFNSSGQVALIKVPYGYFLPGGGIEDNEDHNSCLKREFKEETGYGIDIKKFVDCVAQYTYSHRVGCHLKLIGYFYLVDIKEDKYGKLEDDHELVWRDIADVPNIMNLKYQGWAIKKAYEPFSRAE